MGVWTDREGAEWFVAEQGDDGTQVLLKGVHEMYGLTRVPIGGDGLGCSLVLPVEGARNGDQVPVVAPR